MTRTGERKTITARPIKFAGQSGRSPKFKGFLALIWCLILSSACNLSATAEDSAEKIEERAAKNRAALLKAERNIEEFRKGAVQIKILDKKGAPLSGAKLRVRQISHDFKFGCYLKIDDLAPANLPAYEKQFAKLFNLAVVGTYWDFIENKAGKQNWEWFEKEVALARKLNLKIQAAPLLWGTNKAGSPAWLPQDREELLPVLKQHIESTLKRYENAVEEWEIVNEPLAPQPDVFARSIGPDYIESAFRWARGVSPTERLMINEYGVFGSLSAHNYAEDKYFELLKTLIEKRVPVDVVGIQAHANGQWYEAADVAEKLERYSALGKPIQITEFSAQTLNYSDRQTPLQISGNYQSGIWNERKQAEFYREFYTVAFGAPEVEAIIQWGLDDQRAWLPGIGLIDAGGNPKPNYEMLDRLINQEWRTNLQIDLAGENSAKFRGFYGAYEVEAAAAGGKTVKAKFELKKGGPNEWVLHI